MKNVVSERKDQVVTFDQLPTNLQSGDAVQFVSPSGKVRGTRRRRAVLRLMEYSPLTAFFLFGVYGFLEVERIRHMGLLCAAIIILFLTTMAMTIAMERE